MNNMNWLIYFLGVIVTFIICKIARGKTNNEWSDVVLTMFLTLLSWLGIGIMIILVIIGNIKSYISKKNPPKWL